MLTFPPSTFVNRRIPKNKFYEKLHANQQLKEWFTTKVEAVIWKHKLSRETIGLSPKDEIEEIQVFEIYLKKPIIKRMKTARLFTPITSRSGN